MFKEFKEFALKGNMIDLAVGVVIGGAFSLVINSLVKDMMMPLLGLVLGKIDLTSLKLEITSELIITYGNFLQVFLNFLITAFCIFLIIKVINKARRPETDKDPSNEEALLAEIRDLLKEQKG